MHPPLRDPHLLVHPIGRLGIHHRYWLRHPWIGLHHAKLLQQAIRSQRPCTRKRCGCCPGEDRQITSYRHLRRLWFGCLLLYRRLLPLESHQSLSCHPQDYRRHHHQKLEAPRHASHFDRRHSVLDLVRPPQPRISPQFRTSHSAKERFPTQECHAQPRTKVHGLRSDFRILLGWRALAGHVLICPHLRRLHLVLHLHQ